MTAIRVSLVDVYVVRPARGGLEFLVLRRSPTGGRCAGAWEAVHGHIEADERPVEAARREMLEETGLTPERLYNLSRVEAFYQHHHNEVALVPVFAAVVHAGAQPVLGLEHDAAEWLEPPAAKGRFAWPRERRAVEDVMMLLGGGGAGALEDVLRIV
ncbi:MAG TPA: NUDIX domain-containing protein [Gemmatimonadales bacterium]|nr:NUDIX domain-containing protein [Gemmatimonadales bacterium]